jgi:hypothetical protein
VTYERHNELLKIFKTGDVELVARHMHRHIMEHSLGGSLDSLNKINETRQKHGAQPTVFR